MLQVKILLTHFPQVRFPFWARILRSLCWVDERASLNCSVFLSKQVFSSIISKPPCAYNLRAGTCYQHTASQGWVLDTFTFHSDICLHWPFHSKANEQFNWDPTFLCLCKMSASPAPLTTDHFCIYPYLYRIRVQCPVRSGLWGRKVSNCPQERVSTAWQPSILYLTQLTVRQSGC